MVRWVLGDQLGGASRGVTRLMAYQLMGSRRQVVVGGNKAGANPGCCSEMVEQGGGGRYRWLLVRRQSMKQ